MKIREKENLESVMFAQLKYGDVFKEGRDFYMCIEPYNDTINAICLKNGTLAVFYDSDIVFPIEGEFVER